MRCGIQDIAGDGGELRHNVGVRLQIGQKHLTVCVRQVLTVGGGLSAVACDIFAGGGLHKKLDALQRRAGHGIAFLDQQAALAGIAEGQRLRIVGVHADGLRSGGQNITVRRFDLRHHIGIRLQTGQKDLAVAVRNIATVAGGSPPVARHIFAGRILDLEDCAGQRLFRLHVDLVDDQGPVGRIAKLQRDRLARADLDGLRRRVHDITVFGLRLLHDQRGGGKEILNEDGTSAVRDIFAVGVPDKRAFAVRHEKFHIGQGLVGDGVDLADEDRAFGRVSKVQLDHVRLLSADVRGLRGRVDHMAAVALQLLDRVGALGQPGHGKAAVDRGAIGADHGAAAAGGVAELFDLEDRAADCLAADGVVLVDHQRRQRNVAEGQHLVFAAADIDLLRGLTNGVAGDGLQLRNGVPAVRQIGQMELAVFIGEEVAEVLHRTGLGIVAPVGHLELDALQRLLADAGDFVDRQRRLFMVGKDDRAELVGRQRDELGGLAGGQIPHRRFLLRDLIYAGLQTAQDDLAALIGLFRSQRRAVRFPDLEGRAVQVFAGVRVLLDDTQVGLYIIGQDDLRGLPGEELDVELRLIQHVAFRRCRFLHRVDARLQTLDGDLAVDVCHAVKIVRTVLDLRDAEGRAGQALAGETVQLHELENGLFGVGEEKLSIVAALDADDPLGVVYKVSIRRFQFHDGIAARFQPGQVDLAVRVGTVFLREGAADLRDAEADIRKRLQRLAVDLP